MFVKPFRVKSNNQLKSSDRKKVKQKVLAVYPNITDQEWDLIIPSKSCVNSIRIITHSDEQLTVYSADKRPMFFEVHDKEIYPTVYTLWLVPNLVPVFTTDASVLPILGKGADLMAPGVQRKGDGPKSWGYHRKGDIVAVNLSSNKSCCAVGSMNRSSEDIYMSGGHGVCVNIKHVFGDKLWSIEPSACLQIPVVAAYQPLKANDFPALGQEKEKKAPAKVVEAPPAATAGEGEEEKLEELGDLNLDDLEDVDDEEEVVPEDTPDDILRRAFITVLKTQGKSLKLPLLVSTFYATHVQPACEPKVDIKQTTFKKLGKFLAQMEAEGFITIRQEQKGVEQLASIKHDHPDLVAFIPVAAAPSTASAAESSGPQTHVLLNAMTKVFTITEATYPFFAFFQKSLDANLLEEEVTKCFKEYTLKNKLQDPTDRSKIIPDPVLQKILGQEEASPVPFSYGMNALFSKMPSKYEMRAGAVSSKAGKVPVIQMVLKKCSGNKKVTLVTNLEAYGILINEFAKQCKLAVQASSTITQAKDTKGNQLLVQGNQIRFIYKLLTETYKVPGNRITGLEFAKKEPKQKK